MSVESLEVLKQQLSKLTTQEKISLGNYLLQEARQDNVEDVPDEEISATKCRQRMEWMKRNRAEFGGQYVVLDGDHLLGTAKTYAEGRQLAQASGIADAFVAYLSKPDEVGYMGGW